jgi:hypothetical protein
MSMVWVKRNARQRVRQVKVDRATLEKIADLLGIPAADRGAFHAGTIHVQGSGSQQPAAGKTARSTGRTSRSAASGRARPRK